MQRLTSELSHTVEFDIDDLESSTARLCQYSLIHDDHAEILAGFRPSEKPWNPIVGDSSRISASRGHSVISPSSSLWRENPVAQTEGMSDNLTPSGYQCDADEILAQAQEVPLGHQMGDFIDLHDYVSEGMAF